MQLSPQFTIDSVKEYIIDALMLTITIFYLWIEFN